MFYLDPKKLRDQPVDEEPELSQSSASAVNWPERFRQLAETAVDPRLKAYYAAGVPSGDTPLAEVPLLAMDVETTGLNARKDGIVSIGLIPMTLQRISCARAGHWVVRPRTSLKEESIVIHGITHSQVQQAPDLDQLLEALLQAMQGSVAVVHYRGIERPFLDAALRTRIGEGLEFPVIDTMELEARVHRQKPPGWLDRLLGRQPVSIRLADSRSRYGLPRYRPHHALTDALACAELLQAQIAHRYSPETLLERVWS
ncbi:3'-5' exonuclease [Marinospirillum alkaliphilum]|uniref:DNA polymerase-3 subunit epsilon n=1 Tax=Marinospirillum alkaliphilum DSM 21637 TaxID=1122209 RepID=A0A1K1VLC7_9GAMM|nr:3'-5' exonuclease [Marinospirillum alkaliphilum]SFX25611.1 DNA polymerase-3 subunit epsilon [Marinospirillum alkaliphilum DSM 21637]